MKRAYGRLSSVFVLLLCTGALLLTAGPLSERFFPKELPGRDAFSYPPGESAVQEYVPRTQVEVHGKAARGRGSILSVGEEEICVATCRHVQGGAEPSETELVFPDGFRLAAFDVALPEGSDLAIVRARTEQLSAEQLAGLKQVALRDEAEGDAAAGEEMLLYDGRGFASGRVIAETTAPDAAKEAVLLCYCEAEPGLSGSGVFDSRARFIGVLSMGNDDHEILVVPLSVLRQAFRSWEAEW